MALIAADLRNRRNLRFICDLKIKDLPRKAGRFILQVSIIYYIIAVPSTCSLAKDYRFVNYLTVVRKGINGVKGCYNN